MSTTTELALVAQTQSLRLRMQTQRRLISAQLVPVSDTGNIYPRSVTMRLLLQHPVLVGRLFLGILRLLRR